MTRSILVGAGLTASMMVALLAGAPQRRAAPAPMFSRAYVDALQGVLDLEPNDVAELDQRLARDPADFAARLKLMAYCLRADQVNLELSRSRRVELVLWLIEHQPASEILGSPYAQFPPQELKPEESRRAGTLWSAAVRAHPQDARVFWNAAQFYAPRDRAMYLEDLEKSVALDPQTEYRSRALGGFYAGAILHPSDPQLARHASSVLDTTSNPRLLDPAVKAFQSEYNRSLMIGQENRAAGDLAQRYFRRARVLDPGLDAAWVMPRIEPKMVGMLIPGARPPEVPPQSATQFRRLAPAAFPDLPPAISSQLQSRGCAIPQPSPEGARNVIRGEFFERGQTSWAALCSAGGFSSILVFRSGSDTHPEEIGKGSDNLYAERTLAGKQIYAREITPVNRKFILDHYRAYGGPKPPPIDHQGIDDAFVEKASITYYWYGGKWLQLTGSD